MGERLFAAGETLHAPHLLDLEVAQVLRRYSASGELGPERGLQALEDLADLPLLTRDASLASAAGHSARIELV